MNNTLDYENPRHRPQPRSHPWLPERTFGTVSFVGVLTSIPTGLLMHGLWGVGLWIAVLIFWGMPFAGVICAMIGLGADDRMGWALLGFMANLFWLMFGWAVMLGDPLRGFHLGM